MIKNPSDVIVKLQDARELHGGCVDGWKLFIETQGYNFKEVVLHGLTAQQLIDTGDIMALELAYYMMEKANSNG